MKCCIITLFVRTLLGLLHTLPAIYFLFLGTVRSLYNAIFGVHMNGPYISGLYYKGTILQRNYRKMTILWSFSYVIPM